MNAKQLEWHWWQTTNRLTVSLSLNVWVISSTAQTICTAQHRINLGETIFKRLYELLNNMNSKQKRRVLMATVILTILNGYEWWLLDETKLTTMNNITLYLKNCLTEKNTTYNHTLGQKVSNILQLAERRERKYFLNLDNLLKDEKLDHPAIKKRKSGCNDLPL